MDFQKEEYEIQYYDFCLNDFADQTKLMCDEVVKKVVKKILHKIEAKNGSSPATPEQVDHALTKTVQGIVQKMHVNIRPYENLLDKYLAIPEYIILPEDKEHDIVKHPEVSEADMWNVKIQTQSLEAEVMETAKVIRSLEEELEQYKKVEQSFEDIEQLLDLVESRIDVDFKTTDLKKAMKNIAGLIMDKNTKAV